MFIERTYTACPSCQGVAIKEYCLNLDEEQQSCMRCGFILSREIYHDKVFGIRLDAPRVVSKIGGHGVQMLYQGRSSRLQPLLSPLTQRHIDRFHRAVALGKGDADKSLLVSFSDKRAQVIYGPLVPGIHLMDHSQFFTDQVVLDPAAFIEFWHGMR